MAIPSGSGTEVLKGVGFSYSSVATNSSITAGTHEILTILSATFTATGGANNISILVDNQYIVYNTAIPSSGTFVWDNQLIIQAGDIYKIRIHTATEVMCYVNYILQDWS